ncbi:hypothetical protein HDU76_011865, partial [Blyttiomyces sp. JEL0837]
MSISSSSSLIQDPLNLRKAVKSDDEIKGLKALKKRELSEFYEKQNQLIDEILTPVDKEGESAEELEKRLLK